MRPIFAAALGLSFACAGRPPAPSGQCTQTKASRLTIVYARPDMTSPRVETIGGGDQVCADTELVGFNFRHVKLSDGRDGYVDANDLML